MTKESPKAPRALGGFTIAGLLLASSQAPLGSTMIAVAIPPISQSVGADVALATGVLVTSYLIANIIGQSPGGKLGDVIGYERAVRLGMLLYVTGSMVGFFAPGILALAVSRCATALGGALVVPSTLALLRVFVPRERQGAIFGVFGAAMGLSAAIGPVLGGEVVSRFGWRAIFVTNLPFLAIAFLLGRFWPIPAATGPKTSFADFARRFDWAGSALLAFSLSTLVVATRAHGKTAMGSGLVSAVATLTFVLWELRSKNPVLDPKLFARRGFATGSSIVALQNFAMYGLLFQIPQFFHEVRGREPREVGRYLFAMTIAMFATSLIGGRIADRIGARAAGILGAVPVVVGIFFCSGLGSFSAPREMVLPLVVLGVGIGLSSAPAQLAAMTAVEVTKAGMAAGATSTMRYLGGTFSILLLSTILGEGRATSIDAHETAARAFTVVAVLALLTTFALPGSSAQSRG